MSKNIFILGIGGFGSKVVSLVSLNKSNIVNRMVSLAIDTDVNELNEIENISKFPLTNVETMHNVIDRIGEKKICNWFPTSFDGYNNQFLKVIDMHKGTHLWRLQALLALSDYLLNDENKQEILRKIDEVFIDEDSSTIEFYIVSSLGGGTGSGLFLPLSFFIQNYVKEKYNKIIKIKLILACPDIFSDMMTPELKSKFYANAYVSLQELNNVIEVTNGYNLKAKENNQTIIDYKLYLGSDILFDSLEAKYSDVDLLPYSQVYLFDKVPSISGIIGHQNILTSLINLLIKQDNNVNSLDSRKIYSSLGITKVIYPAQKNVDYVISQKTYDDIANQWLHFYDYVNHQQQLSHDEDSLYKESNRYEAEKFLSILDYLQDADNLDEFILNRFGPADNYNVFIHYTEDNEKLTVEEIRKQLLDYLLNKHKSLDSLEFNDQINALFIDEKINLFDSKKVKLLKKKQIIKPVKELNDIINDFYKICLVDFYKNKTIFIEQEIKPLIEKLIKNDSDELVHPMIAFTRLLRLYNGLRWHLSEHQMIDEEKLYSDSFKVTIPDHLYEINETGKATSNKYINSGDTRFYDVLNGNVNCIRNLSVDYSYIKLDAQKIIDNTKKYINLYYLEITCDYINKLIVHYNQLFKKLKGVLASYNDELKIKKREGTVDSIVLMNVGSSVEEKENLYNEFCKTEDNFKFDDSLVGKLFYDQILDCIEDNKIINDDVANYIYNELYTTYQENFSNNLIIKTIKNINIFELLQRKEILDKNIDIKLISTKLRRLTSGINNPLSIKNIMKNNIDSPVITEKFIISSDLVKYIIDNKISYDIHQDDESEIMNQFLFKIGSLNHVFDVNDELCEKEILFTNEITKMPLYWFNKLDEMNIDNNYYNYYKFIIDKKKISLSELWNPYIFKSRNSHNLLYMNPKMQLEYEKKYSEAFIWMIMNNKLLLNYENKSNNKSKYVYYGINDGFDNPILVNGEVIYENEIDKLFAYIKKEIDLYNIWSQAFEKYYNNELKEIVVSNESSRYTDIVERNILNSSVVKFLFTNYYSYVKKSKRPKEKLVIELLYESTDIHNNNEIVVKNIAKMIKNRIEYYLEESEFDFDTVYKNIITTMISNLSNNVTDIDKLSAMTKWLKQLFS